MRNWILWVTGGVLVVGAIGAFVGLGVTFFSAFATYQTFDADGATRVVSIPTDPAMVWAEPERRNECEILDTETGNPAILSPLVDSYAKEIGPRDWEGRSALDPGSGELAVTCPTTASPIQIGPIPQPSISAETAQILVVGGVGAGIVGLALLVLALLRALRG